MKQSIIGVAILVAGMAFFTGAHAQGLEGAWQTTEVEISGGDNAGTYSDPGASLVIYTGSHYSTMRNMGERPEYPELGQDATDAQRVEQFNTFRGNTGSYTVSGSTITSTPMVARNPNIVGQSLEAEYMLSGDTLTVTSVNAAGTVTTKATLTRLE